MAKTENSGGLCDYYLCQVDNPQRCGQPAYIAECEDIIQALGLTFDEGCEFKSLWRRARARQGFAKAESNALRDAHKAYHYAGRILRFEEAKQPAIILSGAAGSDGFIAHDGESVPNLANGTPIDVIYRDGLTCENRKFSKALEVWRWYGSCGDIISWRLSRG